MGPSGGPELAAAGHDRAVGWLVAGAAGLLALAVRWHLVGGFAGLRGYHGYDDGVYYSSAVAFVHGRMPYRDFLLLHPPGIMLALTPFAALARWTGDSTALAAARLAFIVVGALNTVLVARLARRWGIASAVVAGTLYAVSSAAAYAERLTLLEPLGTLTVLAAVSLLLRARTSDSPRWWLYAGGAALGLGPVVKIWNVVPALVVIAWQAYPHQLRSALHVAAAATASALLVVLPFGLSAPGTMFRLLVLDQLGRARTPGTIATRLEGIVGVDATLPTASASVRAALMASICVTVTTAAVVAWQRDRGRLWVVLLAAETAVILASPSYYNHYAAYSAAAVPPRPGRGGVADPGAPAGRERCAGVPRARLRHRRLTSADAAGLPRGAGARAAPGVGLHRVGLPRRAGGPGRPVEGRVTRLRHARRRLGADLRPREPRPSRPTRAPDPQRTLAARRRGVPDLGIGGRHRPDHRRRLRRRDRPAPAHALDARAGARRGGAASQARSCAGTAVSSADGLPWTRSTTAPRA
ncbi:glycosyltransferase family 39 protein [Cellulomonas sp. P5_E12]